MREVIAEDESVTRYGGCGARSEGELEGVEVVGVGAVAEVMVGGGEGVGGDRAEGLKSHVEDCGCVCWRGVRKRDV